MNIGEAELRDLLRKRGQTAARVKRIKLLASLRTKMEELDDARDGAKVTKAGVVWTPYAEMELGHLHEQLWIRAGKKSRAGKVAMVRALVRLDEHSPRGS